MESRTEVVTPSSPAPSDKLVAVSNTWKAPLLRNAAPAAGDQTLTTWDHRVGRTRQRRRPALPWDSSVVAVHRAIKIVGIKNFAYVCTQMHSEDREGAGFTGAQEADSHPVWVLGIELKASARAASHS